MGELTREEKIALLLAAEEKQRREARRRPEYLPNPTQLQIHQCQKLERWVLSGNGFGKSTLLVNELATFLKGRNPWTNETYPHGMRIACLVDNTRKIGEVLLPEYRKWHELPEEWLKRDGKPHINRICGDRGVEVVFYSAESDPMTLEGVQYHAVLIDEPCPRPLFVALKRSMRIKGFKPRLLFCGTPVHQAWIRTEIYEPWTKGERPEAECFRGDSEENLHNLEEEATRSFWATLSEAERATRKTGAFFDADTMALAHLWRRDVHILPASSLDWNPKWPVVIGLDPHPVKKHVAVMVGANPDNRQIVLKELALKATARQFAEELARWMDGYNVVDIVCDSLGSTEGTGNEGFSTFIEIANTTLRHLRKPGVRSTRYDDKSHEDLIDRLQTGLQIPEVPDNFGRRIPKLRVVSACVGVIENIESVGWQRNRHTGEIKPKLDTTQKDFLSALGYALAANVTFTRDKAAPVYLKQSPYRGLSLRHEHRIRRR